MSVACGKCHVDHMLVACSKCPVVLQEAQDGDSHAEHGRAGETRGCPRLPAPPIQGHGPHEAPCTEVRSHNTEPGLMVLEYMT